MKLRICFAYLLALCISLAFNVLVTAFVFFFGSVGLPNQCSVRILFLLSQSVLHCVGRMFCPTVGYTYTLSAKTQGPQSSLEWPVRHFTPWRSPSLSHFEGQRPFASFHNSARISEDFCVLLS